MKKALLILAGAIAGFLLMFGILALLLTRPIPIGKLVKNSDGTYEFRRERLPIDDPKMPMFEFSFDSGKPMWGYILLDHTNDLRYVSEGLRMKPVLHGVLEIKYAPGNWALPIWTIDGFIDPLTGALLEKTPPRFYAVVWLDKRS